MALTDSLVSYWKLDEASGTRTDSHGSNDLTDNNTVGSATGIINNGADFVAANSEYLSITDGTQSGLDFTGDWSISFWFNTDDNTARQWIVNKFTGGTGGYWLEYNGSAATDTFTMGISNAGTTSESNIDDTPTNGMFHHYVAIFDDSADTWYLYKDDGLVGSNSLTQSPTNGTEDFHIGAQQTPANFMDGVLDEIGIWSRALTASEVTELYNSGNGLAYPFTTASTLTAEQGSFTLTGQTTLFTKAISIIATQASFTLTGQDSALKVAYKMIAAFGSFALTGIAAAFEFFGWTAQTKNNASWTPQTKNSASWSNQSKNSASWANASKNSASWTPQTKNTTNWTNQNKS